MCVLAPACACMHACLHAYIFERSCVFARDYVFELACVFARACLCDCACPCARLYLCGRVSVGELVPMHALVSVVGARFCFGLYIGVC